MSSSRDRGLTADIQTPNTRTPSRRAYSADPPSTSRRGVHTPLDRSGTRDLLRSVRRGATVTPGSVARRNNAPTPHHVAARRALDQRRLAMFTPGKNRRKSQMEQRETPLGILRNLSKALAPSSKRTMASSSSASSSSTPEQPPSRRRSSVRRVSMLPIDSDEPLPEPDVNRDELGSDSPPPLKRPRLSLPIVEDSDDDDLDLRPPRLSGAEDFDYTVGSIELPRRAIAETAASRLSRASLASMPMSDIIDQMDEMDESMRSDFFPGLADDLRAQADRNNTLDRIEIDPRRETGGGSEFDIEVPEDAEDQTTFRLDEPVLDDVQSSPERTLAEATGDNAGAPLIQVAAHSDFGLEAPDFGDPLPEYDDDSDPEPLPAWGDDDQDPIEQPRDVTEEVEEVEGTRDVGEFTEQTVTALLRDRTEVASPATIAQARAQLKSRGKQKRMSRHGIEYPALPSTFVKKIAQTALQSSGLGNTRVSADSLLALTQASEWFFEQLGDDLGAYASHAKRKTIDDSDIATLMKRQRQVTSQSTLFSLAQKHLPRELLQEIRMPLPQTSKISRAQRTSTDEEEEEEEEEEVVDDDT